MKVQGVNESKSTKVCNILRQRPKCACVCFSVWWRCKCYNSEKQPTHTVSHDWTSSPTFNALNDSINSLASGLCCCSLPSNHNISCSKFLSLFENLILSLTLAWDMRPLRNTYWSFSQNEKVYKMVNLLNLL